MMTKTINVALAQIDPEIGNLEANLEKARSFHQGARFNPEECAALNI